MHVDIAVDVVTTMAAQMHVHVNRNAGFEECLLDWAFGGRTRFRVWALVSGIWVHPDLLAWSSTGICMIGRVSWWA